MPTPKEINWARLSVARWVNTSEAAALTCFCESVFIEKIAPALKARTIPGVRKPVYDRHEIDRFMENLSR